MRVFFELAFIAMAFSVRAISVINLTPKENGHTINESNHGGEVQDRQHNRRPKNLVGKQDHEEEAQYYSNINNSVHLSSPLLTSII